MNLREFRNYTKGFLGTLLLVGSFIIISFLYDEVDKKSDLVTVETYYVGEEK